MFPIRGDALWGGEKPFFPSQHPTPFRKKRGILLLRCRSRTCAVIYLPSMGTEYLQKSEVFNLQLPFEAFPVAPGGFSVELPEFFAQVVAVTESAA